MIMKGLRIGNGVDFHKFSSDEGLFEIKIGGIAFPFNKQLIAHSDGDVVLHSICDAIFGSLANGNIGTHFPPSDAKWKDANSKIFLEYATQMLKNANGKILNIDTTIICEAPKIMPNSLKMRQAIALMTGLELSQISIKAVTTEQMGFLGRKEGIGAITTMLICID
jgi:2-C-methyl-D-erythritol 2,4-cyclodiphosphate synthase